MRKKQKQVKQYQFGQGVAERESLEKPFLLWRNDEVFYIDQKGKQLVSINGISTFNYNDEEICYYNEEESKLTFKSGETFLVLEEDWCEDNEQVFFYHEELEGVVWQFDEHHAKALYNVSITSTTSLFVVDEEDNALIVDSNGNLWNITLTKVSQKESSLLERIEALEKRIATLEQNQNTGCCSR